MEQQEETGRPHAYAIQVSQDNGQTWEPWGENPNGVVEDGRDADRLAFGILDMTYRTRLLEEEAREPLGMFRVFVWRGTEAQGPPTATAGDGVEATRAAYGRLLSELSGELEKLDWRKREAQRRAEDLQGGMNTTRRRQERVVLAAFSSGMPQVYIANYADRSREWVRRLVERNAATKPKNEAAE